MRLHELSAGLFQRHPSGNERKVSNEKFDGWITNNSTNLRFFSSRSLGFLEPELEQKLLLVLLFAQLEVWIGLLHVQAARRPFGGLSRGSETPLRFSLQF